MSWRLLTANAAAPVTASIIHPTTGRTEPRAGRRRWPAARVRAARGRSNRGARSASSRRRAPPAGAADGDARQGAALHPVVVVDADPGQGRDLLAPQSRDLPGPVRGEAGLAGLDLRAPRGEEVLHLRLRVHGFETKPPAGPRGCPASTCPEAGDS